MTALGWDAGALAPGRLADFVTIRLDSPRTAGADPSLVATAVFAAAAADVDVVVVDGQQVVSGGNHLARSRRRPRADGGDLGPASMTALVVTGIGQLVTCDPELGRGPLGVVDKAAVVVDEGLVVYAGPGRRRPRRRHPQSTSEAAASCPGSSTPTPT